MEITLLKKQAESTVKKLTDNKWYNALVETIADWLFLLVFMGIWGYAMTKGLHIPIEYVLIHLFLYLYFSNLTNKTYGHHR